MIWSRFTLFFLLTMPALATHAAHEPQSIDPWESMNRRIFAFNDTVDRVALRPIARGYRFVMPDIAERGVRNFIANIYEINAAANSLLQGQFVGAVQNTGRFVINSTIGLAGLFDVATDMGVPPHRADFGQTLAVWGFDSGPFVMLPVWGPRTLRSGIGYLTDSYAAIPTLIDNRDAVWAFRTVELIDYRAQLLQAEGLITGDRYIFIRDVYLQTRKNFVNHGKVEDSFQTEEDEADYEEF